MGLSFVFPHVQNLTLATKANTIESYLDALYVAIQGCN